MKTYGGNIMLNVISIAGYLFLIYYTFLILKKNKGKLLTEDQPGTGSKWITLAGLLTAITVILHAAPTFLPVVGLALSPLSSLPVIIGALLSGGQQQRLCIARALTVEPDVLLMDEPCSALDIKNTANIEDMLLNLLDDYTIIIVTHNLFQAKRISDYTVFILDGEIVEFGETEQIFNNPRDRRTKEYIEGMYG
jgi:ABC-type branched-subunit amino acid transport system ATPase component